LPHNGGTKKTLLTGAFCKRISNNLIIALNIPPHLSCAATLPCEIYIISILLLNTGADMPVPKLICVGWYSLDVLFTSSTICHLCMISVDRYLSLTYPLRYGHAKKKKHTIMKIALVWIVSFCIAGPLFVLSMWDQHLDAIVVQMNA